MTDLTPVTIQITALSPLTFPESKSGTQFRKSQPFIPGAAIYGALGAHYYEPDLFEQLRCHNAYPAQKGDPWVRPLPATATQPKGKDQPECIKDSLVDRVCWELQQPAAFIYAPTDKDGRPWEAAGQKFYTLPGEGNAMQLRSVTQRTLTRVAINRRRGTSQESMIYSPLVLSEVTDNKQTMFLGSIAIPTDKKEKLCQPIKDITLLGGRQTSGLGHVKVEVCKSTQAETATGDRLQERIQAMTTLFHDKAEMYKQLGGKPFEIGDNAIFTINLLSDTILLEDGWLPTQELSATMLKEATGIDATLLRSFTMTKSVGGWNVTWKGPKPTDIAVMMGSVYVFQSKHPLEPSHFAHLAKFQIEGIGERRAEGYGQVRVCDDFHLRKEKKG